MFQGNHENTGVSEAKPIKNPVLNWKTYIGIQGYLNNPVVAQGMIYVGSSGTLHNKPDSKDGIYCLDASNGKVIWHQPTDADACGVAYANGGIFSTGDDGAIRAFDAKSGKEAWKVYRKGEIYCQPLPLKQLIIVGDHEGNLIAFNQNTGGVVWEIKLGNSEVRGGLASDGNLIYATLREGAVACADLSGQLIWTKQVTGDYEEVYPAPTIAGSKLIIQYARDTYYEDPAIIAFDRLSGAEVWRASGGELSMFGNLRSSCAIWDNYIVYGEPYSNELYAVDLETGVYSWKVETGFCMFPHYASPSIAGNMCYLPRHDGGLYAVDLNKKQLKWSFYLGNSAVTGTDFPDDIMPPDWGHCAWEPNHKVGGSLYASPAIDEDGTIYVGSGEGYMYSISNR